MHNSKGKAKNQQSEDRRSMMKDRRDRPGPKTRAESRKPKLDFRQSFPVYRSETEMKRNAE